MREEDSRNFSAAMAASKGRNTSRFLSSSGVGPGSSPDKADSRLPKSGSTTSLPPIGIPRSTHSFSCGGDVAGGGGRGGSSSVNSSPRHYGGKGALSGKYVVQLPLVGSRSKLAHEENPSLAPYDVED